MKITVTEVDIAAAWGAYEDALARDAVLGFKPTNYMAVVTAVAHALAARWSQPELDPVVTERLNKLMKEAKE